LTAFFRRVDNWSNPREGAVLELIGEFMKTRNFQKILTILAVAGLAWSASTALAQNVRLLPATAATSTVPPAAVNASVPQLCYGAAQIVQLVQAKVSDDTIIAYIKNSGNSYGLDANQIIYLRQQGVSEAVITMMLNQPKPAVATATPSMPAPQPADSTVSTAQVSTATVAPTVTYVQTVPATPYDYYQPYYYPAYGWYPPVALSFGWGWGGGWRGGGGWHGGGHGGWHH
jgi:hypothetical protein